MPADVVLYRAGAATRNSAVVGRPGGRVGGLEARISAAGLPVQSAAGRGACGADGTVGQRVWRACAHGGAARPGTAATRRMRTVSAGRVPW